MAIGDDAAAAGMDLVDGATTAANTIDTEINKTRDYIAQRTSSVVAIANGGTGATTAAAARTALGVPSTSHTHDDRYYTKAQVDAKTWSGSDIVSGTITRPVSTTGGGRFGAAWGNNITSTRRSVWMESDGTLGHTASSSRYKKNIAPWAGLTDEQFAALSVVTFQWRDNIDKDDHEEVGMIAEALADAGLEWAIFRDEQGRPEGIHYDRVVLAVIPYVQSLAARVTALES